MSVSATYPEHSRACVVRRFGAPPAVEEVPVSRDIEPGALLVRIVAASVCGTDVHLVRGDLALSVDLPVILGHEMVGEIVALGAGADRDSVGEKLRPGERVVWTHTTCGHCFFCAVSLQPTLCENRRQVMFENIVRAPYLLGGFAEYGYVLPDAGRVRVPRSIDDRLASVSSCALRSVMQAFDVLGPLGSHETVVVQGVGPLGLFAVAVARLCGARRVVAIGAPAERLALAEAFGADRAIDLHATTAEERLALVREVTGGRGADVVMEFAGDASAFAEGVDLARRGGRYVLSGLLGPTEASFVPSRIVTKGLSILGAFSGHVGAYKAALEFLERHRGEVDFGAMIGGAYALEEIGTALERMERMEEIKPMVLP